MTPSKRVYNRKISTCENQQDTRKERKRSDLQQRTKQQQGTVVKIFFFNVSRKRRQLQKLE